MLAFALAFSLFSCDDLTDADIVVEFQNARTTQITFYDQNPIKNPSAKSVGVRYEFEHTFNINTEYPKDLKAGYIPEEWKYIDLQNPSAQPPVNVSVDGEGKIQTVYVTQRALCFYAEGWKSTAPDTPGHTHTFSGDWKSDDTNHWKICDICGKEFSKAAHDWSSGDPCVCGKVQNKEVEITDLVTYLSDEKFKDKTPSVTVIANSDSDISSIKTALKDSRVTSNVAGVDLVLTGNITTIEGHTFNGCTNITSITIPEGVTTIGEQAFASCSKLASITIPSSVTTIGDSAFTSCSSLTSLTIPVGVVTIEKEAFKNCEKLESVTIPSSVTTIGEKAFSDCGSLSSVTVNASTPPILGNTVFLSNKSGRKIYVPADSVETYKTKWLGYASDIEAITP